MIYALVEYINKNGKISIKGFSNKEATDRFVAKLESRNAEYLVTLI